MASPEFLRILHTESSLGWGGQEIRILSEATAMAARGHQVELLCPAESRIFTEAARFGVQATACPIAWKSLRGLFHLRRALSQRKIDVLNTHSSTDSWLCAIACLTLPNPPPIVRTRHISARLSSNPATRWLYTRATRHVVTTGERLRAQVMREVGLTENNVTSVPTGIDTSKFVPGDRANARKRTGLPADKLIIGIVATLRSWKGHRYLIDAFARLDRKDAQLVIVGDGPQAAALREQVGRAAEPSRITFAGNQTEVVPWLQSMDMIALPSYANEGVPQAVLQAMACGLPVISTDVGSIGEIVLDEETGLMAKPKDVDSLIQKMSRLYNNPELRIRLGRAGRAFVAGRHSIDNMADAMEQIFRTIASGGSGSRPDGSIPQDGVDEKNRPHRGENL